ncbi:MAG: hypothetical protein DMG49_21575 [Acidobacteria bacterium]|nr:MAG: hypothetical protein DMG49_21575 [Acidobacteriota bacterium]
MSLREGDSWLYLKFKQTLVESDHNAVFSNGSVLPVFMRTVNGATQLIVEIEYKFFDPRQVPGFIRLEKHPDAQPPVVEAPPVESTKLKGSTWAELKRSAEEQERRARVERYAGQKEQQQGIAAPDSAFAAASRQHAQEIASSRGQSGPNSKVR